MSEKQVQGSQGAQMLRLLASRSIPPREKLSLSEGKQEGKQEGEQEGKQYYRNHLMSGSLQKHKTVCLQLSSLLEKRRFRAHDWSSSVLAEQEAEMVQTYPDPERPRLPPPFSPPPSLCLFPFFFPLLPNTPNICPMPIMYHTLFWILAMDSLSDAEGSQVQVRHTTKAENSK